MNLGRSGGGILLIGLALVVFSPFRLAYAQQAGKVPRIGFITTGYAISIAHLLEGFKQGLREHGYAEGQNVVLEFRYGEAKAEQIPILAADLVRLNVDVIVAAPNPAIDAVRRATQTIPIVMPIGSDPVGAGFAASLARPGGNITGLSAYSPELNGKRLELFKEAVPKIARVAVLYDPASLSTPASVREMKEVFSMAERALKLTIQPWEVRTVDDFDRVFAAIGKQRPDGLYVSSAGSVLRGNRKRIVGFALKSRVPSMYENREFVYDDGLMSYGADQAENHRRVAVYVDKILKGAKPTDLPVEQPTNFEFVINLKTAKQIGVTIPPSVLARADRVIR